MQFYKTSDRLPECDSSPKSLGVGVWIKPAIDGLNLAFFGCRLGATPCFYRNGAQLHGVQSWALAPSLKPGTRWKERDGRFTRSVMIVADGRSADSVPPLQGFEHVSAPFGKIAIIGLDADGNPGGRVTYCKPERFNGRVGGYAPI